MKEKLIPIIITAVAAAGFFALGYEVSFTSHQAQLESCRRVVQQESTRANQLAALNNSLEQRLTKAKAENRRQPENQAEADESVIFENDEKQQRHITLHRGRASVLDGGKLILVLEAVDLSPKRVAIKIKIQGLGEQTAILKPGSSVGIRASGKKMTLVVKNIHASSALITLLGR